MIPVGVAVLIAGSIPSISAFAEKKGESIMSTTPIAQEEMVENEILQEQQENYILLDGKIISIEPQENGNAYVLISDKETEDELHGIRFYVDTDTLLVDQLGNPIEINQLEVGTKVKSYYHKFQAMAMSMPPMTHGNIIIVDTEESLGFTELSFFDNNLVNLNNTLKLNIAEDTPILNQKGEPKTKADLVEQDLLVFYDMTTRSIPAQTTPNKIIIVTKEEVQDLESPVVNTSIADFVNAIIAEDHITNGDITLAPLRKIVEHLGYEISWEEQTKQIRLQKGNSSFLISIGQIQYGYNRSLGQFETLPLVQDGTTYVPVSFIDLLLEIEAQ